MDILAGAPISGNQVHFELGQICGTRGAVMIIPADEIKEALTRHSRGDWGDLDHEDKLANARALANGGRLLSAFKSKCSVKFWIITEANRAVTTVLLPEEY